MVERTVHSDEGFSLTELIVVLALLGVVLAMSFGGLKVVYASRDVSDRQSLFAAEVSSPLNAFEEVISQTLSIESAGPYHITVLTDANNDNLQERHIIQCTADGLVTDQRWATNSTQANTTLELDATWSDHNTNQATATPMFEYFDSTGAQTTNASEAHVVRVTLCVEYDGHEYVDSRTILMRNQ